MRRGAWSGVVIAVLLVVVPAGPWAQEAPAEPVVEAPAGGEPAEEPDPVLVEAGERFDRGVQFYDEGEFGAALAEFLRAYELTGHWGVLYNLGQVSQALQRTADAARYFGEYLAAGGEEISPERRAQVEEALAVLHAHLAFLRVTVDVDGADVLVDGEIVGQAPLGDRLYLSPGPHVVEARHPDHAPVRQEVTLASETEEAVALELIVPVAVAPDPGTAVPVGPVEPEDESIVSQWWFWTIIGVAVAGGAATAGVLLAPAETVWTDGSGGTVQLR